MLVGSADILIIMFLCVSLFKQRIVRDRSAAMLHAPTESATSCSVPRRDGVAAVTTAIATLLGNDHPHWERPRLMHPEPVRDEPVLLLESQGYRHLLPDKLRRRDALRHMVFTSMFVNGTRMTS